MVVVVCVLRHVGRIGGRGGERGGLGVRQSGGTGVSFGSMRWDLKNRSRIRESERLVDGGDGGDGGDGSDDGMPPLGFPRRSLPRIGRPETTVPTL